MSLFESSLTYLTPKRQEEQEHGSESQHNGEGDAVRRPPELCTKTLRYEYGSAKEAKKNGQDGERQILHTHLTNNITDRLLWIVLSTNAAGKVSPGMQRLIENQFARGMPVSAAKCGTSDIRSADLGDSMLFARRFALIPCFGGRLKRRVRLHLHVNSKSW